MDISHKLEVIENRQLTARTHLMRLRGESGLIEKPGQFVNLAIEGKFLRRPISVCDYDDASGVLTLLYDTVGEGTAAMAEWKPGYVADILMPLGNGFDTSKGGEAPLLIGGGIGIAPLYMLAKRLLAEGRKPTVILGFNGRREMVWVDEFRALGVETFVATVSGEEGTKGFVTDVEACHAPEHSYYYACGPMPMLRALCLGMKIPGQVSLESRMGCGFGVCMCCSLETLGGAKRICKDGPVFESGELNFK